MSCRFHARPWSGLAPELLAGMTLTPRAVRDAAAIELAPAALYWLSRTRLDASQSWPMIPSRLPPTDFDAERLVESLASGGNREEVFRQLYERYHRPVYACFARRGFAPEDCRDLMQETFLRLHRGIGGFHRRSRFETWLYEIAANVWRNELRDRSAQKRDAQELHLDAVPAGERGAGAAAPQQVDHLLSEEQARLLRRELDRMPPRMRRCLELRLDQELKMREIAVLMQISVDTVKSQLAQAKQRIRQRLGGYFDPPGGAP